MQDKIVLGVESSCDETSMAIIKNDVLVAHFTTTSADVQSRYGGVVPEVASRYHMKNIHYVFDQVLKQAGISPFDITHIAYTACPGLPGCLHVGITFSKTLAQATGAKLVPINHLYGHLFSAYIESGEPVFPMLGLVASGGHTSIYYAKNYQEIEVLNETQDDAIGEVYDKVARIIGWPYPGGPTIDKNYDESKAKIQFMEGMPATNKFSYSGLKTCVINYVHNKKQHNETIDQVEIASSFQKYAIDDIMKKVKHSLKLNNVNCIALGGGVSANSLLRKKMMELDVQKVDIPLLKYTGDQAAMIAHYGNKLIEEIERNEKLQGVQNVERKNLVH
ncbi:tRNA (adenosine(37)-N6)-threonylcarbamoyltransferase complex transferase subunit TsaD [Ureaplasma ceti]|uniref:tRNA N6-adenosine threonylcarbamoyltransferase n=1 Tax=Ureaplasma ceti TaxID=3119530 RepID=A0ABP9U785_9BACT